MLMPVIEPLFVRNQLIIERWFREQWAVTPPPIYTSIDLRNAGFKLAPVDTNLFPAGFNNLNPDMMSLYGQIAQAAITELCPDLSQVLIISESHTRNIHYFESLAVLRDILEGAGLEVRIGVITDRATVPQTHSLPSGGSLVLEPLLRDQDTISVQGFSPAYVLLNNDLSAGIPAQLCNISQHIMPPIQLGWAKRLKSEHFRYYQEVVKLLSEMLGIDPWILMPYFDQCPEVNFMKRSGQDCLVEHADMILQRIQKKYVEYGVKHSPFLVIKSDQGTYGMAVLMVKDPKTLATLNRKQRTRMSMSKGGVTVTRAIIQEGVYSFETAGKQEAVAEPVLYMMGHYVLGGFYRVHRHRGADENLNAPGMDFEPMPFSVSCFPFYSYSVVARLAVLAAARELAVFQGAVKS